MEQKIAYLMRGLPSCGKSFTARRIIGRSGVVLETDAYFYHCVGSDPAKYNYDAALLDDARQWNFDRFRKAIADQVSPIVVDRGNGRNAESARYAVYAANHGYRVELCEPESPWWQEIRVLLKYKHLTGPVLEDWAQALAERSKQTHRVPAATILDWMQKWRWDLTVDEIINCYQPEDEHV